ncbi:MAG TPA: FG-GAP-like repeat-containing protein, partial [Kofleriaceae bacterium]|nr:FG-GAP-like repeat-containing protein [Kofleriaceae bacterium]
TGWGSVYDANSATLVFADFTGDGRSDALVHRGLQSTLVESAASAPGFVTRPANPGVTGPLLSTGDMNGDRMTDLAIYDSTKITVACSEGGGSFYPCGGTGVPLPAGSRPLTGDFNGDGLTDVLVNGSAASTVYTSTRLGFRARAVTIPLISDVADVDGDGRDDLLQTITTATNTWSLRTHLGRGSVFLPGATLGYPDLAMGSVPSCAPYTYSPQTLVADFTGDGRADPILRTRDPSGGFCAVSGAQFLATATDAPAVDRLASIQSPTGLTLQALYQRSTNPGLPISLPVVKELWIRDFPRVYFNRPISPILETHRYTFLSGKWDPARAEFMGFAQGWDELVERNLTEKVTYFQDTARRGKPSSSLKARTSPYEILSSDHYVYRDDLAAPYRTEVAWHLKRYWAAGAITVSALQGFQYDAAGNLTRLDDHGLCSTTADDRHTITTHRAATDFNVHRMAQQSLYQGAAAPPPELGGTSGGCTGTTTTSLVESTYNEYDGTAASVTRGDLTRSYRLVIAANGSQSWLRERDYTYRADGLPSSITDARGFVTSIMSYDPVLGMYPERVRNAVGHEEVREYEPHFGKLSRVTEPNGGARTMQYDAFGRKRALRTPLAASLWMNTVTWAYGDTLPNWTATVMPFQAAGGAMQGSASVDFRDALGRTIATVRDGDSHQERVLANRTTYWAATEIPATVLAPVEVTVTACGSVLTCLASWATSQPALVDWQTLTTAPGVAVQFAVDPLGRVTRRDNPDGSFVTYAHSVDASGFGLVAFDEVGDQRRLYRDVHGELTRVERWGQAAAQPAITSYQRDVRGKLTGITSPLGVTTQLTWSSLGRLERVVSPELGTLTLGYDNSGNEISRTDARGAVTTTTVDALGRPTYRSTSDGGSTLWVYDRDPLCIFSCASPAVADNTLGRPWAVIDAAGLATFAYDADGHLAREARTIGSTQHTTRSETWTTGQ